MATNPNNNVGTNAAYGGRTSPNAFNDVLAVFAGRGIVSGWACTAGTGMKVSLGADGSNRDVAIAEDNAGNKTTIDNRNSQALEVSIAAAPASQSRIDAIVVYVNNPPQGTAVDTDNPGAIGVLDVQGTTASTPVAPNDSAIRTAITADGASGSTAYYVVLAYVTVVNGTTQITNNMITAGTSAVLKQSAQTIADGSITTAKLANSSVTNAKLDITWTNINDLYYKTGDTVSETFTSTVLSFQGYLTSGNADLVITIPLAKRLDNITSATINSLTCNGRCQGSYLTGLDGAGADIVSLATSVTATISKQTNSIGVLFRKTGGWGGTNNSTASLTPYSYSITLS